MPMPKLLARINKHTFNKLELKKGSRPVLIHVGRTSGDTYRTPLDAHAVDGGYIFFLVYSSSSDWVKNIMASGSAQLTVDGTDVELASPRVVTTEVAWQQLPSGTKRPPGFAKVSEYLRMDTVA